MVIILRNLEEFLKEVSRVTRLLPPLPLVKKVEPIILNAKTASLATGAELKLSRTSAVNETLVLPFLYGGGTTGGVFNVDVTITGPDQKPIATFDSQLLKVDPDKPVIFNPVIVVPEGKDVSVTFKNNTGAAVTNQNIYLTGFRLER